ncbi:MAG: hypothetical protein EKK62_07640 [Acidimicrobiia bacterium]|nr:MAG: hypothetical protein EKK62_07640 [Acidimicrobiia bacterium]
MSVFTRPDAADVLLREASSALLVEQAAAQVAKGAAELVPVDTGTLKRSYRSTKATLDAEGLRATAYTWAKTGHLFEWGSVRQAPLAPLRRAAERLGLRTKPTPKGAA